MSPNRRRDKAHTLAAARDRRRRFFGASASRVHIVTSRVACVLSTEGSYVVVGKLVIEPEGGGIEIGRLHFDVTKDPARRDPLLFVPYP